MTPTDIEALFTHPDGYRFARWGRPVVPVVFGVEDATLQTVKGAIEAAVAVAGHKMAEHDPELGANLMVFFFRDWAELAGVPNLEKLVPDLPAMIAANEAQGAQMSRRFRFDEAGAIRLAVLFLRVDDALSALPMEPLMLEQAARLLLTWGPEAQVMQGGVLPDGIARLLAVAYDPLLPPVARDASHAYRLAARL